MTEQELVELANKWVPAVPDPGYAFGKRYTVLSDISASTLQRLHTVLQIELAAESLKALRAESFAAMVTEETLTVRYPAASAKVRRKMK